ncbi:MAG: hypothetical protein AB8C95_08410 [Phycisphaeraceae bacterium]
MLAQAAQSGWLPYLIFESPGWLMAGLALGFAVTRIIGRRTANPRLLHLSWIAAGLVALLFASSYFVTTQRETLTVALKDLLLAIEDKRLDDVRIMVDEQAMTQFMGDELTREQMLTRIDAVQFDDIILLDSSALLDPQKGFGITGMRINAKGSLSDFPGTQVSEWAIRWKRVDDRWVAIRLECTKFGADALFNRPDE